MPKWIIFAFISALFMPFAANADDYGIEFSANVKKEVVPKLGVAVEGKLQTKKNSSELERLSIGIEVTSSHLDFLRFGLGYIFLTKHYVGMVKGDAELDAYWSPRHRVNLTLTGIVKAWGIRFSVRERYQYTYQHEVSIGKTDAVTGTKGTNVKPAKHESMLRSRFQLEYGIEDIGMTPVASVELYNDFDDRFRISKLKLTLGLDFDIAEGHALSYFYRLTHTTKAGGIDDHLVGLGYSLEF